MSERVFAMPDLGEGLEEGRIVEWLVHEGDAVTLNQPLVEVETAKAAVEIPSPFSGTVVTLHGAAGTDVAVGAALVTFEVDAGGAAARTARDHLDRATDDPRRGSGKTESRGKRSRADSPPPPASSATSVVRAAPAVRRLANDLGIELSSVTGTGPAGRVTEDDVRGASGGTSRGTGPSDLRHEIAEVLTRQVTIPQVTTFRTVDCTALEAARAELDVSPLPIVIAALCRTVADHPIINARWTGDAVELRAEVNVGIAVDTDRGLVVPVVGDATDRGIGDLANEIRRVAEATRGDTLALADVAAPTIAVSNTGSYGSEAGTPILSPGTAVTIALGVIAPRALVVDGQVVARPAATLSCTFDHRVMDGAAAGRALGDLVALLESAERLEGLPR